MKKLCLILLLSSIFMLSCSAKTESTQKSTLVMGTDATFPPFEYITGNGEFAGFDIEFAKEIAKSQNKALKIVDIPFDRLFAALRNGEIDMAISGITITEERKEYLAFSSPYYEALQTVLVRKDDDRFYDISHKDELAKIEIAKIGVQSETTAVSIAKEYSSNSKIVELQSINMIVDGLINGDFDAIIVDQMPAKVFMANTENIRALSLGFDLEYYSIAVDKNNRELLDAINSSINELLRSGDYNRILQYSIDSYIK